MKAPRHKLAKPRKIRFKVILSLFAVFGLIYLFGILVLPYKNIHKDSLQGRLRLSETLKNFPITMACTKPRFTENIADCGVGTCPDVYEINYQTNARKEDISSQIENYIRSLKKPYEYTINVTLETPLNQDCSDIMIDFFHSLDYLVRPSAYE